MKSSLLLLTALLGAPRPSFAGGKVPVSSSDSAPAAVEPNLWTGEGVSLGGVLFPHLHFQTVYGRTSFDDGHEFVAGHHDPAGDGWTVQGLELGLSGRFGDCVETFAAWHGSWEGDSPHHFSSEWEEYFVKLKNLPGGLEVRGGQFLNRFGFHNATHQHAWDWADNHLVAGRMLGDDGLYTRGAEVTWRLPVKWSSVLSVSYGEARTEDHEHAGEEGEEPLYEAAGAGFADDFITANWTNLWQVNDFHQLRGGVSSAWGDNAWSRTTQVIGAHVQYEWRAHGLEPGGDYFRWRTEALWRDVAAMTGHLPGEKMEAEAPMSGSFGDWGLYSSAVYGKALHRGVLEGGLRFDYLAGERAAGLPQRQRLSPVVSYYFNNLRTAYVRAQANFDDIAEHGSEDSVWLSFGFNWGGAEVR